jgi:hypothetical protein
MIHILLPFLEILSLSSFYADQDEDAGAFRALKLVLFFYPFIPPAAFSWKRSGRWFVRYA